MPTNNGVNGVEPSGEEQAQGQVRAELEQDNALEDIQSSDPAGTPAQEPAGGRRLDVEAEQDRVADVTGDTSIGASETEPQLLRTGAQEPAPPLADETEATDSLSEAEAGEPQPVPAGGQEPAPPLADEREAIGSLSEAEAGEPELAPAGDQEPAEPLADETEDVQEPAVTGAVALPLGAAVTQAEPVTSGEVAQVEPTQQAPAAESLQAELPEEEQEAAPPEEPEGAAAIAGAEPPEGVVSGTDAVLARQKKKRQRLAAALIALLVLAAVAGITFWRYLQKPVPLPDLLPIRVDVNYPPHYLFSIYGVDKPVGIAWSPARDSIYVTETGGERLVKVFDREGNLLGSFAPPHTRPAERSPVYLAVDRTGRVFVTDRLQHTVFMYSPEGNLLDAMLCPDLALSEYVSQYAAGFDPSVTMAYNAFEAAVYYRQPGEGEQALPLPPSSSWAPLGVRLDGSGNLLLTDVVAGRHAVRQFSSEVLSAVSWEEFDPPEAIFGTFGEDSAELSYPNVAVADSLDRIYVTDGNNGRISVWDSSGTFLFSFGRGVGEGGLGLPRGAAMDGRDRLHVVDAVEQKINVYDVAGAEPEFLFAFGVWGDGDGQFNFPNDITLDASGRLYIADRENNRIQVWSY